MKYFLTIIKDNNDTIHFLYKSGTTKKEVELKNGVEFLTHNKTSIKDYVTIENIITTENDIKDILEWL